MITFKHCMRALALTTTLSSGFVGPATAATTQAQELQQIFKAIKTVNKGAPLSSEINALANKERVFTPEELLEMCEVAMKKLRNDDEVINSPAYAQLETMLHTFVTQLQNYQVSGFGFARHSSFNILYGRENFDIGLVFKNNSGQTLTQNFNMKYSSFGWQSQWVYRLDFVFVVNGNLSFYDARTPQEFTTGCIGGWRLPFTGPMHEITQAEQQRYEQRDPEFRRNAELFFPPDREGIRWTYPLAVLGITVLPFKAKQGTIIIAHLGIGLTGLTMCYGMLPITAFNLAVIPAGGTLTPKTI